MTPPSDEPPRWTSTFPPVADGDAVRPHSDICLGCGPDNPGGLGLVVVRQGDSLVAEHTFDSRHAGAPEVAHGGAIATAFDDLFGCVMWLVGEFAVTRTLSVDYLKPARIGRRFRLSVSVGPRSGRRVPATAEMIDSDGQLVASATGTVVITDPQAFVEQAHRNDGGPANRRT